MILILLLCLAASRVTQADFKPCPKYSACLYHSRCPQSSPDGEIVLATTDPSQYPVWVAANCTSGMPSNTALFVHPITTHKWNITLHYVLKDVGIKFDDRLTMMANQTGASFKSPSSPDRKPIPYEKGVLSHLFSLVSTDKNLLDIFNGLDIIFMEKGMKNGSTSSKQPSFWQKLHKNTPCDSSLIIDDCTMGTKNCTELNIARLSVKCPSKKLGKMWQKAVNSSWLQLNTVSCDDKKEWLLKTENGTAPSSKGQIEIRCAVEEPEPWATSATGLRASDNVRNAIGEEKKKGESFSLLDSPFTWVGIGLVGIIALVAVILASVYAYRKLWKNQPMDKSGVSKKVVFQPLPQEGSQTGASSNSASEADLGNTDQPVATPPPSVASKAPAAEVSRIDGPNADTVNRLSLIKTMEGVSPVPPAIPGPPSK